MDKRETDNRLSFIIAMLSDFAQYFHLSMSQAYGYLHRFSGIKFLTDNYDIAHTLPYSDVLQAMTNVCKKNGGSLAL